MQGTQVRGKAICWAPPLYEVPPRKQQDTSPFRCISVEQGESLKLCPATAKLVNLPK